MVLWRVSEPTATNGSSASRLTPDGAALAALAQKAVAGVVAATGWSHEAIDATVAGLLAIRRNLEAAVGATADGNAELEAAPKEGRLER